MCVHLLGLLMVVVTSAEEANQLVFVQVECVLIGLKPVTYRISGVLITILLCSNLVKGLPRHLGELSQ